MEKLSAATWRWLRVTPANYVPEGVPLPALRWHRTYIQSSGSHMLVIAETAWASASAYILPRRALCARLGAWVNCQTKLPTAVWFTMNSPGARTKKNEASVHPTLVLAAQWILGAWPGPWLPQSAMTGRDPLPPNASPEALIEHTLLASCWEPFLQLVCSVV
eukprot:s3041_g4.t1